MACGASKCKSIGNVNFCTAAAARPARWRSKKPILFITQRSLPASSDGRVNPDEVVDKVIEDHACRMVLQLAAGAVRQPRVSPHVRAGGPILMLKGDPLGN